MSAVRRRENRAINRSRQSLPYARPPSKKSVRRFPVVPSLARFSDFVFGSSYGASQAY